LTLGCILMAAIFAACKNSEKTASEQEYVKDWETEGVALGILPSVYEKMTPEEIERYRQGLILMDYIETTVKDSVITKDNFPKEGHLYTITISEDEAKALGVSHENYQQALKDIEDTEQFMKDALEKGETFNNPPLSKEESMAGQREKLLEMDKKLFTTGEIETE
ncbi:MAG: hypothetical protein K2J74_05505, partial [Muribaculaceae bacterium]|nr:hypothetical protein [Muribaculaceae bacterium]